VAQLRATRPRRAGGHVVLVKFRTSDAASGAGRETREQTRAFDRRDDRSLIRLAASVVIEQNDEWLVGHRYLSNHSLEAILDQDKKDNSREEARELTAA
jgi:hypothetical protein